MKQAKIFLFDFSSPGDLGNKLRRILGSKNKYVQLQYESFKVSAGSLDRIDIFHKIQGIKPDLVFFVLSESHLRNANSLFQDIKEELLERIIVVIEKGQPEEIFSLLKLGVTDFIIPPLNEIDILPRLWRILRQIQRSKTLTFTLKKRIGLKQLIGENTTFLSEIKKIPLLAKCDSNVLISGETGTGKELCARAIHYLSARANKPFIPVNCGAIPIELVENELFGHVQGAYTNASTLEPGLIHEANNGTLFLDEIDCLPFSAQVKLLRFLQEKEYRQIGSTKIKHANVRVIAATSIDLEKALSEGEFRQDLYYRINVIPVKLPPLRDRQEDIPILARYFLAKYSPEFNKRVTNFTSDAIQKLMCYKWKGNIRELEHVIERAVFSSTKEFIQSSDVILPNSASYAHQESFKEAKANVINQFEKSYIQRLLFVHQGNITKAAHAAKKNRRAFWQLIRKHRINVQNFIQR